MQLLSSPRVPVERLRMENGREGRVMREMRGLEEPPVAPHRGASLQVRPLVLPTESETGQTRPSPILPHESSSRVSSLPKRLTWIHAEFYWISESNMLANVAHNIILGNTSPRAISRAERERKVSMRLHRGAPANVSSSDLTARHDQSRISTSQVKRVKALDFRWLSVKKLSMSRVHQNSLFSFIFRSVCHLSTWGSRVLWLSWNTKLTGKV